ncbi:hypothetical protein B0H16DRAFT_1517736 [Mycena metata]|uniref:Uncharacterized protein n=1 Tax=Mycena metata TaxID=1033252 RepID=A0AAD7JPR6_9AGAR|nr:hypothetical protein B0H16DRAFT_1517736 [Mycena metata]
MVGACPVLVVLSMLAPYSAHFCGRFSALATRDVKATGLAWPCLCVSVTLCFYLPCAKAFSQK